MLRKVKDYIKLNNMIQKGDRIVVGVSGGADSVCLLSMLAKMYKDGWVKLIVIHINHGIRGDEAIEDEQFVAQVCESLDLEYHSFSYDVPRIAELEKLTQEEAGRKIRYQTFLKVCKEKKCNKIAVAHNKNDNAETVLFHLFRGSGIRGLSGIQPVSRLKYQEEEFSVIRPLLCLERLEIESYLEENGLSYQMDRTNLTDEYSRNKIRNHILNYASREINLNSVAHIADASLQLREIDHFLNHCIHMRYNSLVTQTEDGALCVKVKELEKEDVVIQKGILRRIMEQMAGNLKDLELLHVEQIRSLLTKQVGKRVYLPYGMLALRSYQSIKFYKNCNNLLMQSQARVKTEPRSVPIPGKVYLPGSNTFLETKLMEYKNNQAIPKSSCVKWFDYDKIENALVVRNRREGDYIQINSKGGRKKLKDYFIDQKIPRMERDSQLLIADGSHIMWILGSNERISEKYKVDKDTKNVLLMNLINTEDYGNER
ncbi:MAG: tRNA lysidine(34) synthetase TilS [Clostridiales bacterium]|nr:tRNA lysidine(34) synthetase TilS [Clostridiales bacterium]